MENRNEKNQQPNKMPGQNPQKPNEPRKSPGTEKEDVSRKQSGQVGMNNPGQGRDKR